MPRFQFTNLGSPEQLIGQLDALDWEAGGPWNVIINMEDGPRIQLDEQGSADQTVAQLEALDWSDGPWDTVASLTPPN